MNKHLAGDTSLEAARVQYGALRKIGPDRRAQIVFDLSDGLRELVEAGVRQRHPEYSEKMVRLAALRLTMGEKTFNSAYNHAGTKL